MNSLKLLPRRIFAFVARDFRLYVSYRMQFFLRILSVLTVVTTLFFISKIFAGFTDPQFTQWRDPLGAWLTGLDVESNEYRQTNQAGKERRGVLPEPVTTE